MSEEAKQVDAKQIVSQITQEETMTGFATKKIDEAIFIEENPDLILEKLLKLSDCTIKERIAYTKHLSELIAIMNDQGIQALQEIIKIIVILILFIKVVNQLKDTDQVKKELIHQLQGICDLLKNREDGYQLIIEVVVKALQQLLDSQNQDVHTLNTISIFQIKEEAGKQITTIAPYLNEDDKGNLILPKVISLAHDDKNEENRIVAVKLIGRLCNTFGQHYTESFLMFEILSLGEDVQQRVRKEAVLQLALIGREIKYELLVNRLIPFYLKFYIIIVDKYVYRKSEDPLWQMRKSCVDIIVSISQLCENEVKETIIVQKMIAFLTDNNKWVRAAAYKQLGPLIETMKQTQLNDKLFEHYLKMTDSEVKDIGIDNEILQNCAFNFPAVLQTYGKERWPQMTKLFQQLLRIKDYKERVKKPLACALHDIAFILGPVLTQKELLQVLEQVLKDNNDDIKYGAIKNLSKFFKVFEVDKRQGLIEIFLILQKDQKKWRIRELIARQIDDLANIFDPDTVSQMLIPISFKLCNDLIYQVRKKAAKRVYSLMRATNKTLVIENIQGFAVSNTCSQRQTYNIKINE